MGTVGTRDAQRRGRNSSAGVVNADVLVSVAGLVGVSVRGAEGAVLGRLVDATVRWDGGAYPPVTGVVVRVGGRRIFVHARDLDELSARETRLRTNRLVLDEFERRDGEVMLMRDVVDHQLVDTEGVQVIRASDLYVARVAGELRLVGAEVGLSALVRRLGPARLRARAVPSRVIDWSLIQPVDAAGDALGLSQRRDELPRMRPADLAALLEQLANPRRQELLSQLDPELAADVVEDMRDEDVAELFRSASTDDAVRLLEHMDPDEAADALRDLKDARQEELLDALSTDSRASVEAVLTWDEDSAGGIMTTDFAAATPDTSVSAALARLRDYWDEHQSDPRSLVVVDADGRLVDTITVLELALARPDQRVEELVAPPWPVQVAPGDDLPTLVQHLRASRGETLVVVDAEQHPIGRIDGDDIVDALTEDPTHGIAWTETR